MTMINLFELEAVSGGDDGQYTFYWDTVIYLSKRTGKTLEKLLADLRDAGQPQEMIDYVIEHW